MERNWSSALLVLIFGAFAIVSLADLCTSKTVFAVKITLVRISHPVSSADWLVNVRAENAAYVFI